jgi:hypothetical protein
MSSQCIVLGGEIVLASELPSNPVAGDKIIVENPDGRPIEIVIPISCVGGQSIYVYTNHSDMIRVCMTNHFITNHFIGLAQLIRFLSEIKF